MNDYQTYLSSPRWQKLSAAVRKWAGYRCQLCNAKGKLHVHHRSYQHLGTKQEWRDLIVLCDRCHHLTHWASTHTEPGILVWQATRILNRLFASLDGSFEKWLLRHVLTGIGVLYYLKTEDFTGANLAALQDFLETVENSDEVWQYAYIFTFGTEKDLKALAVDKRHVSRVLKLFLRSITAQYREYYKLLGDRK